MVWDQEYTTILTIKHCCTCRAKHPTILHREIFGRITIEDEKIFWTCCGCNRKEELQVIHMFEIPKKRRVFFLRDIPGAIVQYVYRLEYVKPVDDRVLDVDTNWKEVEQEIVSCPKCKNNTISSKRTPYGTNLTQGMEYKEVFWCPSCGRIELKHIFRSAICSCPR